MHNVSKDKLVEESKVFLLGNPNLARNDEGIPGS